MRMRPEALHALAPVYLREAGATQIPLAPTVQPIGSMRKHKMVEKISHLFNQNAGITTSPQYNL